MERSIKVVETDSEKSISKDIYDDFQCFLLKSFCMVK